MKRLIFRILLLVQCSVVALSLLLSQTNNVTVDKALLPAMHSISSHTIDKYIRELASEKYQGRLTGTPAYNACAQWMADLLKQWGTQPSGDKGTYFQHFPNPYTLVFPGAEMILHLPIGKQDTVRKSYVYEEEFYPGSTSDAGSITAEVVYVGYGITAPELKYDDYEGIDVKGKIVMMDREVPVSTDPDVELFKKWRPYSFHDYKVNNANAHGAAGMIYNYHIVNPNCAWQKNFILTHVSQVVVDDIFRGSGKKHRDMVRSIQKELKPVSFATGKLATITCKTEHHPEGVGLNVLAMIEGTDPVLKNEVILIGAHLDHVGLNHKLMPGANDNASGVAVLMEAAGALSKVRSSLKRSVAFILFGAEEQGVKGSEYYVQHPAFQNEKTKFINLESVGRGEKISVSAGKNYPQIWEAFDRNNTAYIHREISTGFTSNIARPRQDLAHFLWANIPSVGLGVYGSPPVPVATYHTTQDLPEYCTPEIMEDLARLLFLATVDLASAVSTQ
ncbi:MAG: M28 family metallopeptidase [bacterium]